MNGWPHICMLVQRDSCVCVCLYHCMCVYVYMCIHQNLKELP